MFLLLGLACTGGKESAETGLESQGESVLESTTQESDTQESNPGDESVVYNHVVASLTVADRGEGIDLNEDGEADNAAWVLGVVLDPLIASALSGAERVLVLQVADVENLNVDASVQVSLLSATDTDADPSDNLSGETFSAGVAVDANGRAYVGANAELSSGVYEVELLGESLVVGELELSTATPFYLLGTLSGQDNTGLLGFGLSVDALTAALVAAGYAEEAELVVQLADLDTDSDGEADALSVAMYFEGLPCGLVP